MATSLILPSLHVSYMMCIQREYKAHIADVQQ